MHFLLSAWTDGPVVGELKFTHNNNRLDLIARLARFSERQNDHWFQAEKDDEYYAQCRILTFNIFYSSIHTIFFVAKSDFNKEEKIKALENLVTATELSDSSTKDGDYLSAQEPVSSEVARTGRLRRSTISKHVVEKATIGGSTSNFAPALISSTLQMSRLRF